MGTYTLCNSKEEVVVKWGKFKEQNQKEGNDWIDISTYQMMNVILISKLNLNPDKMLKVHL